MGRKPADFVVDRSKWRAGGNGKYSIGKGATKLLNPEGFECCLGQTTGQEGFSDNSRLNIGLPHSLPVRCKIESKFSVITGMTRVHTALSESAYKINDTDTETLPKKEARLRSLFEKHGLRLVFKGKSVPNPNRHKS